MCLVQGDVPTPQHRLCPGTLFQPGSDVDVCICVCMCVRVPGRTIQMHISIYAHVHACVCKHYTRICDMWYVSLYMQYSNNAFITGETRIKDGGFIDAPHQAGCGAPMIVVFCFCCFLLLLSIHCAVHVAHCVLLIRPQR